jgi:hypothetical protein
VGREGALEFVSTLSHEFLKKDARQNLRRRGGRQAAHPPLAGIPNGDHFAICGKGAPIDLAIHLNRDGIARVRSECHARKLAHQGVKVAADMVAVGGGLSLAADCLAISIGPLGECIGRMAVKVASRKTAPLESDIG